MRRSRSSIRARVVEPTYAALRREGLGYAGVLYFGLMITADGPKVLEFNVRFGDPETQVLLPMLGADLGELCEAMTRGQARARRRAPMPPEPGAALGVVIASRGYPESAEKGVLVAPIPRPAGSGVARLPCLDGVRRRGQACARAVGDASPPSGIGRDLAEAAIRAYAAAEQ